jgi:hypothetical protein
MTRPHMKTRTTRRKRPRTFSLSDDVVNVLELYRKEKKLESLTSALEEIVREWKKAHLSAQVAAYYDSLSDQEMAGEHAWGAFSESQI